MFDHTGTQGLAIRVITAAVAGLFLAGLLRPPIAVTAIHRSLPLRLVVPATPAPVPVPSPRGPWAAPVRPVMEMIAVSEKATREALPLPVAAAPATCGESPADGETEAVRGELRLPPSPLYDLRCRFNAHAASHTAERLVSALTSLRERYAGQIVIGDMSRRGGVAFGRHQSHRTGHDVDLWLPVLGGSYRSDAGCASCGTRWCRPQLAEIDWAATWALVQALVATDAVEHIFVDRVLHPKLRTAALAAGVTPEAVSRLIQRGPALPALVMHSAGHTRHMHVRFESGPLAGSCALADR